MSNKITNLRIVPGRTSNGCQFRWRRLVNSKVKLSQSGSGRSSSGSIPPSAISEVKTPTSNQEAGLLICDVTQSTTPTSARRLRAAASLSHADPEEELRDWTPEEDELLRYSQKQGLRFEELSILLPARPEAQILHRLEELNVKK